MRNLIQVSEATYNEIRGKLPVDRVSATGIIDLLGVGIQAENRLNREKLDVKIIPIDHPSVEENAHKLVEQKKAHTPWAFYQSWRHSEDTNEHTAQATE